MWGLVGLVHAAAGLALLVTLSTGTYVVANVVLSLAVPATLLAVSVAWFRRTLMLCRVISKPGKDPAPRQAASSSRYAKMSP